ncbi:MAG: hypothetical protein OEX19_17750, partial [Gammaproteobacteria bacterium]|nr:hypothetical protein [Gammaproteobacteria bacterium]
MNSLTPVALEYHQDALSIIASHIITEQQENLPRLNDVLIIIPDYQARHRLTRLLATEAEKRGFSALLPPQISTLRDYIEKNITLGTAILPAEQRSLVLMEALQQHKQLFNHANLWTAGDALLKLFDQLTLYQSTLPESLDDFIQQLEQAYGCTTDEIQHLGHEARLIHTLWQAWHHQLEANDNVDNNAAYLIKLARAIAHPMTFKALYLVHHQDFLPAESQWLDHARQTYPGCEFFYSYEQEGMHDTPDKPALGEFLDRVLEHNDVDLRHRAISFRLQQETSPAKNHIRHYKAPGFEEEARAISIQIRQWRLQNIKRVGLIIEDRQLARRIRALLDRANIALRDAGGWALSTTSAAALLESWLVAIEEDFAYKPLLTVIKSPFFLVSTERLEAVHHFEYDIIRHENITRDLSRYRNAISSRLRRQNSPASNTSEALYGLIDDIENAAQPLNALLKR